VIRCRRTVLRDVSLTITPRAKIGVVGPRGAGKSALLALIAGVDPPAAGTARLAPDVSVSVLAQDAPLDDTQTVWGNIEGAVAPIKALLTRFDELSKLHGADPAGRTLDTLGELQTAIDNTGGWDIDARVEQVMYALRCPPGQAPVEKLSGRQRRRVALCMALLRPSDLLVLDEPTNHLDVEAVAWIEQYLRSYRGTVVMATHDRYLLDGVADEVVDVGRGRVQSCRGNYTTYLQTKFNQLPSPVLGCQDAQDRRHLLTELESARTPPQSRQALSRWRLSQYQQMVENGYRKRDFDEIRIPPGPPLGTMVIAAEEVTKVFGGAPLIRDLSFRLPRNGIVGVIGAYGTGKTTLLQMIAGLDRPDAGELRIGDTVRISYVDQTAAGIDAGASAWDLVSGTHAFVEIGGVEIATREYLDAFGLRGDQEKPIAQFSGGERSRLHLALTLCAGGNVLLLDEPTDGLDIDTIASLERALLDFPGCVLIVTNDRWLLDRVATHILACEATDDDPGRWFFHEGNFTGYMHNKLDRLGADAAGQRSVASSPAWQGLRR
jgi:ATP-binding cassette ChvD family protein